MFPRATGAHPGQAPDGSKGGGTSIPDAPDLSVEREEGEEKAAPSSLVAGALLLAHPSLLLLRGVQDSFPVSNTLPVKALNIYNKPGPEGGLCRSYPDMLV